MPRGRTQPLAQSSGGSSVSQQPVENEPEEVKFSPLTDQEELEKAQRIAANSVSESYKSYETPELSKQKDKSGRFMIAYPCKINLLKHASNCLRKQQENKKKQSLAALGITGKGDIDPKELCAVWCAEAARPFSALADPSHKSLLHPVVLKNLPTSKAVSKDIHLLYSAIQGEYRSVLQAHKGALYLGVDAWQSPNGFDILGVVIYRLKVIEETGDFELESMPLDFVQLLQRHTGNYLAHVVRLVVEKFGIQDCICGIKKRGTGNDRSTSIDDEETSLEEDNPDAQIKLLSPDEDVISNHGDDSSEGHSTDDEVIEDSESLNESDIENGSEEDEGDRYTSESCKHTLGKLNSLSYAGRKGARLHIALIEMFVHVGIRQMLSSRA
ncbi:hypothetical protein PGTUg99_013080 [Puccinia graminis f. sp. tritici]|uniref:Uncharacterized protein n=1 Tax=Puccinia graminis f. sp. tritici TaxID=56615 RepID=A0A5B0NV11_PUCGR|nr:hypothetical protein PGTUg99_013080 [Puccinia graminis f. sp. tritici]